MDRQKTLYALVITILLIILLIVKCGMSAPVGTPPKNPSDTPPPIHRDTFELPKCGNFKSKERLIEEAVDLTREFGECLTKITSSPIDKRDNPAVCKSKFQDWSINTIEIIPDVGKPRVTKTVEDYLKGYYKSPCEYNIKWDVVKSYDSLTIRAHKAGEYVVDIPITQYYYRSPCPEIVGKEDAHEDNTDKTVTVHIIVSYGEGCPTEPCCSLKLGNIRANGIYIPETLKD